MKNIYKNMGELSLSIFNKSTPVEHLIKLKNESEEAINKPDDIFEHVDCLLSLFAASYKSGFTFEDLIKASEDKLEILKKRKWKILEDGTYQHY